MDGDLGFWTIKPDQMQVINPLLILIFIPLYEVAFYPLLSLLGIRRPLQKLTLGGIFAGIAFVISTIVEIQLEGTYAVMPQAGESQLRIFNGMPCEYNVQTEVPNHDTFILKSMEMFEEKYIAVNGNKSFTYTFTSNTPGCADFTDRFELEEYKQISYLVNNRDGEPKLFRYEDNTDKSSKGFPMFRVLGNTAQDRPIVFKDLDADPQFDRHSNTTYFHDIIESYPSRYEISVDNKKLMEYSMRLGGVYAFIISENGNELVSSPSNVFIYVKISNSNFPFQKAEAIVVTEPNSINMLWLVPQYVVMTLGEVMYSITGLEFSFTQAPESMKSVLQGCWQLTVAVGNLIVVIVAEAKIFEAQKWEFVLFACLMFIDMAIFAVLAYYYKPIPIKSYSDEDDANTTLPIEDRKDDRGLENPTFTKGE